MDVALVNNASLARAPGKEQLFTRDAVEHVVSINSLCLGTSLFDTSLMTMAKA